MRKFRTVTDLARMAAICFALLLVTGAGFGQSAAPNEYDQPVPTGAGVQHNSQGYSNAISNGYNFRFGKDHPFTPSNAQLQSGDFIQPGAFPNAEYCAHCHQEAYHQWRQALHSNAFRAPFYRTSVNILIRTKGIEFSRHCDSCHNPIGLLSGALTQNSQVNRKFDDNGVTCMVCHSVQGLKSTSGNGGYIMGVPAVMVDEHGNRLPGEVPYEDIMNHTDRHVRAVMQSFTGRLSFVLHVTKQIFHSNSTTSSSSARFQPMMSGRIPSSRTRIR